jgi:predicted dehydrogenase
MMSFAHLHAESYAQILKAMPGVEFIGIADDNLERGRYFAEMFDVQPYDSYQELLQEQPDGVIVCSENARHRLLVEMAAKAHTHILCEKPLATTLADAQTIVNICNQNRVTLMTAFPMRFSAPILEIKKLVESGNLGQIYGVNSTNQGALPEFHVAHNLPFLKRDWFVDKTLAGGGAVADHTVHLADMMRWLFDSEVIEVYAETNQILHRGKVGVETGGLVMLTFANGTFASIDCSWSKPAYYPTWGGATMELVGERGLATVDAFKQTMTVYRDSVGRPQWEYWGSDANRAMLAEFVAAIAEKRSPTVTGFDGYKAVEIVVAAYKSAQTGQPVTLPLNS